MGTSRGVLDSVKRQMQKNIFNVWYGSEYDKFEIFSNKWLKYEIVDKNGNIASF